MNSNLKTLISRAEIEARVAEMGRKITGDYGNDEILIVSPLKGAFVFCADLIRNLDLPLRLDFIELSSYHSAVSSGDVRLVKDLTHEIQGKHVLLVEDILDSGLTIQFAMNLLEKKMPASLSLAVLLDKKKTGIVPHYTGFEIEDHFVVGYGMDYRGFCRNFPSICILDESGIQEIDSKHVK